MRLLALALVAACSNLQPITPECGNGIIEVGEDCDSGPECVQCSIRCTVGSDGQHSPDCPDQVIYTCGADQLCHAPGGRFHDATAGFSFAAQGFGVTDINADGFGDVVALSGSSLMVDLGDATGELSRQSSMLTPFLSGEPAVTHLDPDLTLDIVMPTFDGLVAYTSPHDVIAPYPFPIALPSTEIMPKMAIPLDHQYLGIVFLDGTGKLAVGVVDGNQKMAATAVIEHVAVCPTFDASQFDASRSDLYDGGTPATPSYILAFSAGAAGTLCTVQLASNPGNTSNPYTITELATGITIENTPVLATLDNTGCVSIVDSDPTGSGTVTIYHPSVVVGSCVLASSSSTINIDVGATVVGHVPLIPALTNQEPDALAASDGVYALSTGGVVTQLFHAVRPIVAIRSLDVDGDGDIDVIASAGQMFDDLVVLYRFGGSAIGSAGFLPVEVATAGSPNHLTVGDFDGDGIGDFAYTEKLANGERLMVAFGSRDQIQPATEVSTYTNVLATATIGLADSADPTGTKIRDLMVVDEPADATFFLTILYGSPQRTLVPFFDPRPPGAGSLGFRGALSGNFGQAAGGYQDLVAVESFTPPGARFWVIALGAAGVGVVKEVTSAALGDCAGSPMSPFFCLNGSLFVAWHGASSDPDIVVGLERTSGMGPQHRVIALDPQATAASPIASLALDSSLGLDPSLAVRQTYLADADGDGVDELIVGYGPTAESGDSAGEVMTCTFAGGSPSCTALDVPDLAGWACYDAMPANVVEHQRFDPLPTQTSADLVMLCHRGAETELFHVFHDAQGFHAEPRLALPSTVQYVELADVSGDGVEDVLAVDADASNAVPVLRVYIQCTSRDVDACSAPGVP